MKTKILMTEVVSLGEPHFIGAKQRNVEETPEWFNAGKLGPKPMYYKSLKSLAVAIRKAGFEGVDQTIKKD